MKLRLTSVFSVFALLALFTNTSFAAGLSLTNIGSLNLQGNKYSDWWYTVANPNLVGKAEAGSTVSIKIDDVTTNTTATSSGDWVISTTMAMGDHKIVITQGSESYSFTLHLTETLPATFTSTTTTQTSQSSTTVPATGSDQLVALGLGLGLTLFATYLYISGDTSKKLVFERQFIKE